MGCAASRPMVDDGARDVPIRIDKTPKESPSHSFHERTLAKLLSGSRHGEGRHSQVTVVKTENLVDKGESVGDAEVELKDVKEKRKFGRGSSGSNILGVSSSVDDIGLERGRSEDTNIRRSPATLSMKRSKSVDSRPGERSIRANFRNKNTTEPSEKTERTDDGGGKNAREDWNAESRDDGNGKKASGKESKSKGDARAEQGGSLMSKIKYNSKDALQKSRLARSGSGGGIMKTIGGITTAVLAGPPNNSVSMEEEKGKSKASSSRIEIVAFEIANIIVRVLNLRNSLRPNDIEELKREVLSSEGVRQLVSEDELDLWCIAAEDKRMELQSVAKEVARLGALCPESTYRFLVHDFNMLGTVEEPKPKRSPEEVEQELKYLESQAQVTAELYHELISLKSLEQTYQKKLLGEDKVDDKGASHQKEPLPLMKNEVKTQEKNVKLLKKKSLWSKRVDLVVEKLVEVIIYLHQLIVSVFGAQGRPHTSGSVVKVGGLMDRPRECPADLQKLGVSGLSIHYANIINVIDNLAMRPFAATQLRDTLYHMLSPSVRRQLKKALMKSGNMEQEDTDVIMERMESVLDWLVTMGANTVRYSAERRLQGHTELTLLQTLYHANQGRTESLMVELLVSLNHVASRHRRQGEPERSPIPHAPIIAPIPEEKEGGSEEENNSSCVREGGAGIGPTVVRGCPPGRLADLTPEDQKEDEDDDDDLGEEWKTRESRGDFDRSHVAGPYAMFGLEEKNMFVPPMPRSEPPKTLPGTIGEDPIPRSLSRHSLSLSKGSYLEIELNDLPSPSRPPRITTNDITFPDVFSTDVPPRTPPSIVAYRKLYASLSEEERMKIEKLAREGVEAPPGISKSLEFKRVGSMGFVAQGLSGRVYSSGGLIKSPLAHESTFLSPRSQSFSFSRSLSRSNSSTPAFGGEGSPRPSRVRAMTPPAVDVDALGDGGSLD